MRILNKNKSQHTNIDFEEILNSAQNVIFVIHPRDEVILEANKGACDIFGYQKDELIGKKLSDLCHNIEYERKKINECLLNNSRNNYESLRITADNREICFEVTTSKIKYENNNAILQFCRDITKRKAFEEALKDSETKYRALYDNHPLILISINSENKIVSINQNGAKELGYNPDELIGSDVSGLFAAKESKRLVKQIQNVIDNAGKPSSHEMKMLRRNQTEFWVRETIYASAGSNFKPQIFFVCDNITYQKNAEAQAKDLAHSLQNMLDASPLGVLVYRMDDNGELIFISTNQSAVNILKIDLYSLISKKIGEIFPGLVSEGIIEKFNKVILTGNPLNNQTLKYKDEHFNGYYEFSVMRLTDKTVAVFFTDVTEKQKALEALQESELKYKTLYESANDAIFLMKDNKFIDCNLKALEIFQCDKDKIIGNSPEDFSPNYQSDGTFSAESFRDRSKLVLNNKPQFFEWTYQKSDGSDFFAEISLKKIEFKNDSYIQAIVRDVTERKKSEKIINDQRRELSTLMSNLPGMAYRCSNNATWTMHFVSEGCFPLTGYTPEDLLNDNRISYASLIHKSDLQLVNDVAQKALANHEPFTLLYRIITLNGEEKWVWEKGRGIYDEAGNILHLEGFISDITETKIAEEKIKMLAHAVTSVTECVCIADLRERIKFINKSFSRVYGYELEELAGKHISVLRSDKNDPEIVRRILPETLSGGWTGELLNVRKDGEEFPIHLSTSLIVDDDGHPIATTGIIIDITDRLKREKELKEAKEKAEEASRLKTSFFTNISHELRTPLVGILGFAEIIKDEVEQPEIANMAQLILRSGNRLMETLNSVLDLSRIEANKVSLNYSDFNLPDFIKENIKFFDKLAADKGLALLINILDKDVQVYLDGQILYQILNNLIGNAIKYTEKGSVIVEVDSFFRNKKKFATIKIIDTGIGIRKENLQQIFEEFRQVSEGLNRRFEGSGLGLTITKKFVEMMSGEISVESEIDKGSIFTLTFNAIEAKIENKAVGSIPESITRENIKNKSITNSPSRAEVLMVENDPASRKVTSLFLKDFCNISFAETGEEAIEKAKEKKFNAILMDINLGRGLTGVEAAKMIKKLEGYENVPIVALTAFAMAGEREEFLRNGCTHYLSKPFRKDEILKLVQEIVSH